MGLAEIDVTILIIDEIKYYMDIYIELKNGFILF